MTEKTATKPKTMRLLSLLLVVTMLVTAQGFTSLAATVSRNEVATEERETESSPEAQSSPETESNTASENITESETSDTTQAETVMQAGTTTPANPVHNCTGENDGTDTTTWSYVYFGSYPQSEVTDTTIISAIDSAILSGSGITADAGTDVWVNGTKYRRISKSDTNYSGYFDEVTNNGYRYFK